MAIVNSNMAALGALALAAAQGDEKAIDEAANFFNGANPKNSTVSVDFFAKFIPPEVRAALGGQATPTAVPQTPPAPQASPVPSAPQTTGQSGIGLSTVANPDAPVPPGPLGFPAGQTPQISGPFGGTSPVPPAAPGATPPIFQALAALQNTQERPQFAPAAPVATQGRISDASNLATLLANAQAGRPQGLTLGQLIQGGI